ncbi:uncharacterized protein LOC126470389 [Schistocerca serialis cubense]|uniref:uncharacterized protein LOC126470389 n=2 Tax=Schistocerca TaxID=7008 RepID=UPI00214E6189|nr:uncharacterized protein LOC126470389 [Schistocerca serialis cubense]
MSQAPLLIRMVGSFSIQQVLVDQVQVLSKQSDQLLKTMATSSPPSKRPGLQSGKRDTFTRSSSFVRLKQFPAYLCTRSCDAFPNVLLFLSTALTFIQGYTQQLSVLYKKYGISVSLCGALIVLLGQVIGCCMGLVLGNKPPGLIFLLCCIIFIAVIGYQICLQTKVVRIRHRKLKTH